MERKTSEHRDTSTPLEQDISIHIFTVSSAMVGVCLTVIGLIHVVITLGTADTLADDFLAGDALLFLISCPLLIGRHVPGRYPECIVSKGSPMEYSSTP
jgi:hypothetical protein